MYSRCTLSHWLPDCLHHTFNETIALQVTRARHDVVEVVLVWKGCKFLWWEWGTIVCHNGLRHSILTKNLLQDLGSSTHGGAVYFPYHRKPTVVVCYHNKMTFVDDLEDSNAISQELWVYGFITVENSLHWSLLSSSLEEVDGNLSLIQAIHLLPPHK